MLMWKTQMWEKNHGSPQTSENHYERKIQKSGEAQRQRPLVSFLRHTAVTLRQRPHSLSLSHALYVHSYTHYAHTTTKCSTTTLRLP